MTITTSQIKQILIEKDIQYLYHANTVATAVTFLNNRGLLSRGAVEERGLSQTPQESDESDKTLGVFYDIFFDSDDIHVRANDLNKYGPVTFVYSIDVLDSIPHYVVKVTRDNPIQWDKTMPEPERYFTELNLMRDEYHKGTFKQQLTICNINEPLLFSPHLVKILLENPHIDNSTYFNTAKNTIKNLLEYNSINVPLEIRQCSDDCNCQKGYKTRKEGFTYYRFRINIEK